MVIIPLILPLIPLVAWGAAAIAGAVIAKKVFFSDEEVQEVQKEVIKAKKIAILGMQYSGKTILLNRLRGIKNYAPIASGIDDYEAFDLHLKNGSKVRIASNFDIGGSPNFVSQYAKVTEGANICFFLFDVSKFLNDESYYRDFSSRVDFLDFLLPSTKLVFFGTHADKVQGKDTAQIKNLIIEKLSHKKYKMKVISSLFVLNLLDNNQVDPFINKIFE